MMTMPHSLTRRQMLQATAGAAGLGWLDVLAARANEVRAPGKRYKSCIVLWTGGGLSQMESFSMKPDAAEEVRGELKPVATSVPGIQICELLPRLAEQMRNLTIVRSMSTIKGTPSHGAGITLMHSAGWSEDAPARLVRPNMGSSISAALARPEFRIPTHVVIAGRSEGTVGIGSSGYLGRQHAAMVIPDATTAVNGIRSIVEPTAFDDRLRLFEAMENGFAQTQAAHGQVAAHGVVYRRAVEFMRSEQLKAFDLSLVPASLRDRYGRNDWGNGCLMASRLVEIGVPFVKVCTKINYDHHDNLFPVIRPILPVMDAGVATLIEDLKQRGLLDTTLVVCMGEFGRSPKINSKRKGREHFGNAWSILMAGAGLKPGFVLGGTTADGEEVTDHPVSAGDLMATICRALDIDPNLEFGSRTGERLTPETGTAQRMAAGDGVRLLGKNAKVVTELFS